MGLVSLLLTRHSHDVIRTEQGIVDVLTKPEPRPLSSTCYETLVFRGPKTELRRYHPSFWTAVKENYRIRQNVRHGVPPTHL